MKTYTVTRECPVLYTRKWGPDHDWDADDQPCEGELEVIYETPSWPRGGPEDFIPVEDTFTCSNGHEVPYDQKWWDKDWKALNDDMQDRLEEARESSYQSRSERY